MVCGYTSCLFTYRTMKQLSKLIDQTIENNKNYYSTKSYWTHYNIVRNITVHITSKSKLANFSKKLDCLLACYDHTINHDYGYIGYSNGSFKNTYSWEIEFDIIAVDMRKNSVDYYNKRFAYLSLLTFYHQCFQEWLHEKL